MKMMNTVLVFYMFLHTQNSFSVTAISYLVYSGIWVVVLTDDGVQVMDRKGENVILEDEDEEDDGTET